MRPTPEQAEDINVAKRHNRMSARVHKRLERETASENRDWYRVRDPVSGFEELGRKGEDHAEDHVVRKVVNQTCLGVDCDRLVDGLWCDDCCPRSCYGEGCRAQISERDDGWFCPGCASDYGFEHPIFAQEQ